MDADLRTAAGQTGDQPEGHPQPHAPGTIRPCMVAGGQGAMPNIGAHGPLVIDNGGIDTEVIASQGVMGMRDAHRDPRCRRYFELIPIT
jgi:hypothetical protein